MLRVLARDRAAIALLLLLSFAGCDRYPVPEAAPAQNKVVSTRIYGKIGRHCAFPAVARHGDYLWCVFREGPTHVGAGGVVRILRSSDGVKWELYQTLKLESDAPTHDPDPDEVVFNGYNQYMVIPHHTDFDFRASGSFSVSAWVRTENTGYSQFVSTRNGGNGFDFGHQDAWLFTDFADPYLRASTTSGYSSGAWHHVGFAYDGLSHSLGIYQDGVRMSLSGGEAYYPQTSFSGQENTYGNNIFVFAKASNRGSSASGGYSQGSMKALRFWNKALSQEEMAADMSATVTASTPGLIAAYDFAGRSESGNDVVVPDITGRHPGYLKNYVGDLEATADLRDPRIINTPDGGLLIVADGEKYDGGRVISRRPYYSRLQEDGFFADLSASVVNYPKDAPSSLNFWIWSPRFHGSDLYGFDYIDGKLALLKSTDCAQTFETVKAFRAADFGNPSEVDLVFDDADRMYVFIRRNGAGNALATSKAWMGEADAPYTDWTFSELDYRLEGQAVLALDSETFLIGSRAFDEENANPRTALFTIDRRGNILRTVTLRSGSDCSYPGIVVENGQILTVYYSSHEGVASIYRSFVPLSMLEAGMPSAELSSEAPTYHVDIQ